MYLIFSHSLPSRLWTTSDVVKASQSFFTNVTMKGILVDRRSRCCLNPHRRVPLTLSPVLALGTAWACPEEGLQEDSPGGTIPVSQINKLKTRKVESYSSSQYQHSGYSVVIKNAGGLSYQGLCRWKEPSLHHIKARGAVLGALLSEVDICLITALSIETQILP